MLVMQLQQQAEKVVSHSTGLVDFAIGLVNSAINPLNPKSDQHQISPCNSNAL